MHKHQTYYIKIDAPKFLYWFSKMTGTKGNAKMAAFWPFILTSDKVHPKMNEYLINHELIHFAQQKEMFIIGAWIFQIFEWIYIAVSKRKTGMDAYLLRSTEQEAYDNMFDLEYFSERKHFAHLKKYWNFKPVVWTEYLKKMLQIEGFPFVYEWTDEAGTEYKEHAHTGKVSFFVISGEVVFSLGINKKVSAGERCDVPPGYYSHGQSWSRWLHLYCWARDRR